MMLQQQRKTIIVIMMMSFMIVSMKVLTTSAWIMTSTTTVLASARNSNTPLMSAIEVDNNEVILGKDRTVRHHNHNQLPTDRDLLVRAARGLEPTERTPVWLMRQAGRYMKAFREYSDTMKFRDRSESSDIATELSLQCSRAYGMDGIILFSDILTPLPCIGIDFDVITGTGPVIQNIIRTENDVDQLPFYPFHEKISFISDILKQLSFDAEAENTSLIGFVGAPFTLAAYIVEQKSSKHCLKIKQMMYENDAGEDETITKLLNKLAILIGNYGIYQIENGAQIIQMFESWAHHVNPTQFEQYVKPAALQAISIIKNKYPNVPIIYYANGGSSYLELQRDMVDPITKANMIGIDWSINMKTAREILGSNIPISGNIDPNILRLGTKEQIEEAVRQCIDDAGGPGNYHVLNLGHGVMQNTPEIAVKWLIDEVKRYGVRHE